MKRCKKIFRCVPALWAVLMLTFGFAVVVRAADAASLDFDRTGSVMLTLADGDGNAVSGGTVTLYEVASLYMDDGNMAYAGTDDFSGCTADLDVTDASLAETLAEYAETNGISGTAAVVGTDGIVMFENLELGLYLIVQTEASDNYETFNPFVVTVPIDSDGEWVYAVDASPKAGTMTTTTSEEDSSEDTSVPKTTETAAETGGAGGTSLPQTGQLFWPIPVLAGCGVLLFALGWSLKSFDGKRNGHAV